MKMKEIPGVIDSYLQQNLYICECEKNRIEEACFYLKSHSQYIWLVDIIVLDKMRENGHFCLKYVFQFFDESKLLNLQFHIKPGDEVASIAHLWTNGVPLEREAYELFGIQFNRTYDKDFFASDSQVYPMRKSEKRSPEVKNLFMDQLWEDARVETFLSGHQLNVYYQESQNLIKQCQVQSGRYHIGFEKIVEGLSFKEAQMYVENYFPDHASPWSFLMCHIAEEANEITIPDRAKAVRMVTLELNRILSHLLSFRELTTYLQSNRYLKQSLIWIKKIQALIISSCGNEYYKNFIRLGGLRYDISQSWLSRVITDLTAVGQEVQKAYAYISQSEQWKETLGIELTSKNTAQNRSLSGPLARAIGLNIDQRKLNPFYFYGDVSFEVPVGTSGTLMDLVTIRFEEIFQSISIITQVLDNLPAGKYLSTQFEHFEKLKTDLTPENEQAYRAGVENIFQIGDFNGTFILEGSHGNLVPHIVYMNDKVERLKLYTNHINLKGIFENNLVGKDREFLGLAWAALNIDLKSIER